MDLFWLIKRNNIVQRFLYTYNVQVHATNNDIVILSIKRLDKTVKTCNMQNDSSIVLYVKTRFYDFNVKKYHEYIKEQSICNKMFSKILRVI